MNYLKIHTASLCDGLGVRVVLFVSGCPHHCDGCHNPESWNYKAGRPFTTDTMEQLMELLDKPYIKGLTLSGGDPLCPENIEEVTKLADIVKFAFPDKDIWCYTGYEYEDVKHLDIMNYVDYVVDGKFEIDKRSLTLPFRGSTNQHIVQVAPF